MLSLVAILWAVVLMIYAQLLRSMLAHPFWKIHASILPSGTQAPEALADLYQRAEQELTGLGFDQPVWVLHEFDAPGISPKSGVSSCLFQVYRHAGEGSLVWLGPPVDLRYPNRLVSRFSTRLGDGRTLSSHAFDHYFDVTATPEAPGKRLKGGTLEQQWRQHQRWRAKFTQATDPRSLEESEILEEAGARYNSRIDRLVERKRLWRDSAGVARARLGFGLRILVCSLLRPARITLSEAVPPARLALLSEIVEQVRSNPVPALVQWGLFVSSVVLFILLGGVLWDQQLALILLGVIAFHEAGHFLAMRAFGYRNVQMLMLPLVGGVTLGFEKTPSAAQRAWMSLMGPLPGIVLGWALFGCMFLLPGEPWPWLRTVATTLLVVNYLNVLPLPPLDGSRLVQALLPARWAGLQAVFVSVACVVGAAAAWVAGYPRLTVIACVTLITIPSLWQRRNVIRALLREGVPSQHQTTATRLTRVLEMFERQAVPMKGAQARILHAEAVLQTLDTGAMAVPQRAALTGVYGLLMVVPVVAIAGYWAFAGQRLRVDASVALSGDPEASIYESARRQAQAKAANMDIAQFIADLKERDYETFPTGLSEERIAAVEARLGVKFPEDIRALYRVSNGVTSLHLAPLEQATRPDPALLAQFTANAREGEVQIIRSGANLNDHVYYAGAGLLNNTVRLGPQEASPRFANLVDLNHPQLVEGHSLISASANGRHVFLHAIDLRGSLQETWVILQAQDVMSQRYAQQAAVVVETLRGEDVAHLLEHFPQPGFLVRTFFRVRAPRLPGPATEVELSAAERRLGQSLPPDLRTFLLLHDGWPMLFLLPAAGYFPVAGSQAGPTLLEVVEQHNKQLAKGHARPPLDVENLRKCIVIAGIDQGDPQVFPTLAWCPNLGGQIVDLDAEKSYPDFTAFLRAEVARSMVNVRLPHPYLQ